MIGTYFHNSGDNGEHIPHLHLRVSKELREFYAFTSIKTFAIALIGIFEPIYVYLHFGESLPHVFIYLGIRYMTFGLLAPMGAKLPSKWGIKHTFLLSIPLLLSYYFLLWHIEWFGAWALLLGMLTGLRSAVYWPAHHMFFTRFSQKGRRGRELSYRTIFLSISAAIAPVVGGFIIMQFGFATLFIVVMTLLFASLVPLLFSREVEEDYHDHYFEWMRDMFRPSYRKKTAAFFSEGFDTVVEGYVWPLFLFIAAISFSELGMIASATFIAGMIYAFYVGRKTDAVGSEKLLGMGAILNAVLWPIKMFVHTPLDAFLATIVHKFGRTAAYVPFVTMFYDWAGEHKTTRDRNIVFRESVLNTSRGLVLGAFAIIFYFHDNLALAFLLSAFVSLGVLFMIKDPKEVFSFKKEPALSK